VPSLVQRTPASLDQLRRLAPAGKLYAILDACDEPTVPKKCAELGEQRAISLYRGAAQEKHAHVAPYLAQADDGLIDWIAQTIWKRPWGIFAWVDASFDESRKHFRRFLQAQLPDGREMLFRFYDPRVLPTYLHNCNPEELRDFYGPARAFGLSTESADQVILLHRRGSGQ
jgi:hypothetical protein